MPRVDVTASARPMYLSSIILVGLEALSAERCWGGGGGGPQASVGLSSGLSIGYSAVMVQFHSVLCCRVSGWSHVSRDELVSTHVRLGVGVGVLQEGWICDSQGYDPRRSVEFEKSLVSAVAMP